jgi:hypothetical protein
VKSSTKGTTTSAPRSGHYPYPTLLHEEETELGSQQQSILASLFNTTILKEQQLPPPFTSHYCIVEDF